MKIAVCAVVLAFLTAIALVFISVPTFAQTSLKIAVVDTDKAIKESIWGKKAIEELERETEKWQEKGNQLDKEMAELEENLAKQRNFLDDKEAEQKLLDEIDSKRIEGRTLIQQGNAYLSGKREELLEPILEETNNLIKKLSMEEGYDIVLEKQLFVLYLNPELDITSQVVVMLDKVYKEQVSNRAKESEKPVPSSDSGQASERSEAKDTK